KVLSCAVTTARRKRRMARTPSVPAYRLHRPSGSAVVTLPDGFGGRRDVRLGRYDTPESRQEYNRVIGEWLAAGRRLPSTSAPAALTLNELMLVYWQHAESYYKFTNERGDAGCLRSVLRLLRDIYGPTPAAEFTGLRLKACREKMITLGW